MSRFSFQRPKRLDDAIYLGGDRVAITEPTYVVAEIGINHNGDIGLACQMIAEAASCGADAVKFQKRTIDAVYTPEELATPRESPWGDTTDDQKRGLEFGQLDYEIIAEAAKSAGIHWFASPWDVESVLFLESIRPAPVAMKIASPCLTNMPLVKCIADVGLPVIMSTGMSTEEEIDEAVETVLSVNNELALMHAVSAYPCEDTDLALPFISWLMEAYDPLPVGYSGHERGIATTIAAVVLGACIVERHFTLDRTMYGSDQAASLEPQGFARMVRDIRAFEASMSNSAFFEARQLFDCEKPAHQKLRKYVR